MSGRDYVEPRFEYAVLSPKKDAVICKLDTGALYELPVVALDCAEGWDSTVAAEAAVVEKGLGAVVEFASGARIEFAADFVLYHCEPRYPWRKDRPRAGERIRRLRERAGMSLEDLSMRTGIAAPNLSRLEHGKHHPLIGTLQRIARALGVPPRRLLGG